MSSPTIRTHKISKLEISALSAPVREEQFSLKLLYNPLTCKIIGSSIIHRVGGRQPHQKEFPQRPANLCIIHF